jgi:hypothetical protein
VTVEGPEAEAEWDPYDFEAIHLWFNLSYANYLVLPRALLQSMPDEWQKRFVLCLDELVETMREVPQADRYRVQPIDDRGRFMKDPVPHYNRGRTRVGPA